MARIGIALATSTILAMSSPAMAQEESVPAFRVQLGGESAETEVPASYAWLENIGACSTTCGTGTRQTTYQCQNIADFDYTSGGYGAPEDEAYCSYSDGAKPADRTSSCTVYSGCSYDWVNPPVDETPIPLGSNPVGRVGCGYVNEVFSPYCQRSGGGTNVILGATDHEFCSGDRPDYDNVASGDPDALGYDRNVSQTSACAPIDHDWQRGAWGPWSSTCSSNAVRTRTISCERRFDGSTQPDARCDQSQDHAATQVQPVYSGCTYSRGTTLTNTGPWGDACATDTSRTLTYNCLRSDGTTVAATECTSRSVDLTRTETGSNYAGCSYAWTPNDSTSGWGPSSDTCSSSANQTRTVICQRSNGDTVADSNCSGTKPVTSRTIADYSSCTYSRGTTITNTGPWASGCSSNTSRTLTYNCLRSDGTSVSASECTSRGVSLTRTETGSNYASCSYAWSPNDTTSGWGSPSSTCSSSAIQTRTVVCRRSNGDTVGDSNCTGTRPASSRTIANYSSCTYSRGAVTNTGAWASGCSSNTTRTLTHACRRSDGTNVSSSECTSRSVSLTTTETGSNYAGCSYAWNTGGWGPSSSTCSSSAMQSRSVSCRRSDGTTVSDSSCSGTKPASSRTVADYSGCSYSWSVGGWGPSSNTCSASATQTRGVNCRRSDGTHVSDSSCSGTKPATSRTVADYSSCSYSWSVGGWGPSSNTCSSSATQTRGVNCRRSDGTHVSDSSCSGAKPATSRTVADYSSCSYSWSVGGWGPSSNTCSASATQTRGVNCRRSDGTHVSDSSCSGAKPATSRTIADYSSCSYSRGSVTGSSWNNTCSDSATRTTTYACRRSDGTNVSTSECTSRSVSLTTTTTGPNYSSCTYTLIDAGEGTCSASGQRSHNWQCRRDQTGQLVDSATYCGRASTTTESCTPPVTVLYSTSYGIQGDCNGPPGTTYSEPVSPTQNYYKYGLQGEFRRCQAAGGRRMDFRIERCVWIADNYRQDYDEHGEYNCVR